MANPLVAVRDFLVADAANLPAGAARTTVAPSTVATGATVIQYAWDGSASDADNREDAAVRVTVWTARGKVTDAQDVALGLRRRLLAHSSASVWRVDRGAGRLPGIDPDSELPFCTFTVYIAMKLPE